LLLFFSRKTEGKRVLDTFFVSLCSAKNTRKEEIGWFIGCVVLEEKRYAACESVGLRKPPLSVLQAVASTKPTVKEVQNPLFFTHCCCCPFLIVRL
jgi:hypothetical protein